MWKNLGAWHCVFEKISTRRERKELTLKASESLSQPPAAKIFEAFRATPPGHVRVVICGSDPYPSGSTGIPFEVPHNLPIKGSLQNIAKELSFEYQQVVGNVDVKMWCRQGVLLLNSSLTVRNPTNTSAWTNFTRALIQDLNQSKKSLVFLLWGRQAQKLGKYIDYNRHLVLSSSHPSSRSANRQNGTWWENGHFLRCNEYLQSHGQPQIKWF